MSDTKPGDVRSLDPTKQEVKAYMKNSERGVIVTVPARDVRVGDLLVTAAAVFRIEQIESYGVRALRHTNDWPLVGLYGGSRYPWGGNGIRVFRDPDELVQLVRDESDRGEG